jgi:Zn-finger nucleic acid-binding protein
MTCPACGVELSSALLGGDAVTVQMHRCPECGGLWLAGGEMRRILERKRAGRASNARGSHGSDTVRDCRHCRVRDCRHCAYRRRPAARG